MAALNTIEFTKIKLAIVKKELTKCYINYSVPKDNKLIIALPVSTVAFDVDFSYNRPNISINLVDQELIDFNSHLKNFIIESVYKNSKKIYGAQKTMEALSELYCNPHKSAPVGKKYTDLMQLKINKNSLPELNFLNKKSKVALTVHISGLWFSEKSFGPYINVIGIEAPEIKKCDFVDSDTELHF